jgi:hypothetical protein
MIPWLLVGVGAAGCVMAGVSFLFDYRYGAQFKKAMGSVPSVIQRSAGGWLRIFLISLAVLAVGLLLMGVCSRRKTVVPPDDELGMTAHESANLPVLSYPNRPPAGRR